MSPAILRRIEDLDGNGWALIYGLDCFAMPGPHSDDGFSPGGKFVPIGERVFAWTGQSLEYWVSQDDRWKLYNEGFQLNTYFCPPGTFHIGHEQAVFDKDAAICVAKESLI